MSPAREEQLGKVLLVIAFGGLAINQGIDVARRLAAPVHPPLWGIVVVSQLLSLFFVGFVVAMTLRRGPASRNAAGWRPRAAAIGGTFALMLLVLLPPGRASPAVQLLALTLMVIGTAASIYCLHYLGRSFAVLAAARDLVTRGPYGIVRHPLYVAEAITVVGVILAHWSWGAVGLGIAQAALQLIRVRHEEAVLRAAFPQYADYAARVPMLIPGARPA